MRSTAYKVKIEDLVNGRYVSSAEGEPNYLVTPWNQQVLRVNLIATIIDKFIREDGTYATLQIDDGTATIRAKAWEEGAERMDEFNVGALVKVIGKVREYEGEIHLVPEVIRKIEDPNWEIVRELEILDNRKELLAQGVTPKLPSKTGEKETEKKKGEEVAPTTLEVEQVGTIEKIEGEPRPEISDDLKDKALLALEKLEGEDGTTPPDLAAELDISASKAEDVIATLINDDKIYEPNPGKFKLLR
ncbi:hypothetical protein AKJ44_00920 [candidate division MSBL1 archaeon SCGC-AAA261F17]|uniref:OB domain-containing protein n=1 Tax=candidate division MSBL1 archaeon SCGC-AAA261F17 TaxID=1698274 RepID=A0A133V742_9EURY|nr:hypothetical protein AKJ44_00920 [candidate division MSBL1 archaeon SCGC-AAA261F17]